MVKNFPFLLFAVALVIVVCYLPTTHSWERLPLKASDLLLQQLQISSIPFSHFSRMEESQESDMTSEPTQTPSPSTACVVASSEVGFVRTLGAGIVVEKGVIARLSFSIQVHGVVSSELDQSDKTFLKELPSSDLECYSMLKSNYSDGLNVPFLDWVGINLNQNVSSDCQDNVARSRKKYRGLVVLARKILTEQPVRGIRVSGKKTIVATSFIPTIYYAFIKVAKVILSNGESVTVVSANPRDVAIATGDGSNILDFGADEFKVELIAS